MKLEISQFLNGLILLENKEMDAIEKLAFCLHLVWAISTV